MRSPSIALPLVLALSTVLAAADPAPDKAQIARGAYLVRIMSCNDCHTPFKMGPKGPEPDMTRLLSGHPQEVAMPPAPALGHGPWVWAGSGTMTAYSGPWGTSFAANLTPDAQTGIGNWTVQTFIDAMRNGRFEGQGRPLLPPMPFQNIASATDDDLRAIFAYLRSIPPVRNKVPQPVDPPEAH